MISALRERTLYYAAIQAELKRPSSYPPLSILLPGSTKPPSPHSSPTHSLPDFHELAAAVAEASA
jgi:hypothetical protein